MYYLTPHYTAEDYHKFRPIPRYWPSAPILGYEVNSIVHAFQNWISQGSRLSENGMYCEDYFAVDWFGPRRFCGFGSDV